MNEAKNPRQQKVVKILAGVVILGLAAVGFYIMRNVSQETTDDAYIEGRINIIAPKTSGTVLKVVRFRAS